MLDMRNADPAAFFRHWFDVCALRAYGARDVEGAREELKRLVNECYRNTKGETAK
jgi:hypothetical protein